MGTLINNLIILKANRLTGAIGKKMTESELDAILDFCERRKEPFDFETIFSVWITGGHKRSW